MVGWRVTVCMCVVLIENVYIFLTAIIAYVHRTRHSKPNKAGPFSSRLWQHERRRTSDETAKMNQLASKRRYSCHGVQQYKRRFYGSFHDNTKDASLTITRLPR